MSSTTKQTSDNNPWEFGGMDFYKKRITEFR